MSAMRPLSTSWTLWYHDTSEDWSEASYQQLVTVHTLEEVVALTSLCNEPQLSSNMLFVMKEGVLPLWEHVSNRTGGAFSYKVPNVDVVRVWKDMVARLTGQTMTSQGSMLQDINGISISPKNNFVILKVWMASQRHTDPRMLVSGMDVLGIFKAYAS